MAKKLLVLSIMLLGFIAGYGQQVRIKGHAPSFAGDTLVFKTYSDQITYNEETIEKVAVDARGDFSGTLRVVEPSYIFVLLGAQKGYLFADPGKSYTLILPTKVPKTEEQRLNPFFTEESFQVGIADCPKTDINFLTSMFDEGFNEQFTKIAQESYKNRGKVKIDSSIYLLDTIGRKLHNPFFESYKKYRFGLLQHLVMVYKSKGISDKYFANRPILYNNPSYMELFNQIFDRFFLFFNHPSKEDNLASSISDASLTRLKKVLSKDSVLKDEGLLELVILKGIYDGFYDDNFSRKSLLVLLDSLYFTSTIAEHKVIATSIREKVIRLLPGHFPPEIRLYNIKGKLVTLEQLKGKFVYLNFCSVNSYTCLQDFSLLEQIYKKYGDKVEIISISTDPDIQDLKHFLVNKPYKWTFVHYGTAPSIINQYDVRGYPTYFLINPEGKIELSPAPTPHEKLEIMLVNHLRSRDML